MFPETRGRDRHGDRGHLLGTGDMKLPVLGPEFLSHLAVCPIHELARGLLGEGWAVRMAAWRRTSL